MADVRRRTGVTAIIPTLNNERTIGRCIAALWSQTQPPDEVIVIDCGSEDRTQEIARASGILIVSSVANRCYQQNLGAARASGDYLLFLDADMILTRGVIEEALTVAAQSDPVALVVPEISHGSTFWARVKAFERSFYQGVWWIEAVRWLPREVFAAIGGFDPTMTGTEDWDLDQRVRRVANIDRLQSFAHHDEGALRLLPLGARKAHYSATFDRFRTRYPERARLAMGVGPRARVFMRQPRRLLRHPVLSASVGVMGMVEIAATRGWYSVGDPWSREKPFSEDAVASDGAL